ncbi:cellulose binding domain-containing protein [Nonomuraea basaltis]|uniref:cellulose binding domain-containing protein n=1 Tax=Nonomuraea basaltis TaxID=2495887 RepID=UPI001980AECD|nr:cellulose binding domain-containing protein [Nonomuraea basaltis]
MNKWPGGFQSAVTVKNTGTTALSGWQVTWTLPHCQTSTQSWSSDLSVSGSAVTAKNMFWNGRLNASDSTTFGLLGGSTTTTTEPIKVTCTTS